MSTSTTEGIVEKASSRSLEEVVRKEKDATKQQKVALDYLKPEKRSIRYMYKVLKRVSDPLSLTAILYYLNCGPDCDPIEPRLRKALAFCSGNVGYFQALAELLDLKALADAVIDSDSDSDSEKSVSDSSSDSDSDTETKNTSDTEDTVSDDTTEILSLLSGLSGRSGKSSKSSATSKSGISGLMGGVDNDLLWAYVELAGKGKKKRHSKSYGESLFGTGGYNSELAVQKAFSGLAGFL